jgi:hypothetical protein
MATRKKAEPKEEKPDPKSEQAQPKEAAGEEILQKAAKAIGTALGKAAVKTGLAHPETKSKKIPKLVKKAKPRLPRKAKKQAKKKLLSQAP